jgi:hypothetical protein
MHARLIDQKHAWLRPWSIRALSVGRREKVENPRPPPRILRSVKAWRVCVWSTESGWQKVESRNQVGQAFVRRSQGRRVVQSHLLRPHRCCRSCRRFLVAQAHVKVLVGHAVLVEFHAGCFQLRHTVRVTVKMVRLLQSYGGADGFQTVRTPRRPDTLSAI